MKRDLLEQPFTTEQIKQRAGSFGQTLDYIEGHAVIKRLNDAFDGQWSFQVRSHDVLEAEVIVLGELIASNISKSQFGSSAITKAKNSGEIISLADDLKAATTDSLKKCATMFGVGLHLYSGQSAQPHKRLQSQHQSPTPPGYASEDRDSNNSSYDNSTKGNGGNGDNGNGGNGTSRLSNKQYNYLLTLGTNHGLTKKDIDQKAIGEFGSAVAYLSKNDASTMIKLMLSN
ncbi:Rad52/Rad22 family DNA repair protein [Desulfopila inferna]|uniref:Rad52/Rad22 family DNA repair protein n=1 Tax=Desulfopila inferna TaxID=468528 RepID=UPI001962C3E6|nr:Rad52/Rad22 family DNA repair protein [Desulfopila inferna]MBM9606741.1 hypothetical protein [Desulfopila inferna]